eukprot:1006145-Karenia_brevis.AAC.1
MDSNPADEVHIEAESDMKAIEDELEPWEDFIKRATHIAEKTLTQLGITQWTTTLWQRQWRWAHRIASQDRLRWSRLVATWRPELDRARVAARAPGRPYRRWNDHITDFLKHHPTTSTDISRNRHWLDIAASTNLWQQLENDFIQHMQQQSQARAPKKPTSDSTNPQNDANENTQTACTHNESDDQ